MSKKTRLSASVDEELVEAGRRAVAEGRAANLSGWVNAGLQRQAEHDGRLQALGDFIEWYETENGEISEQEMHESIRRLRSGAMVIRGSRSETGRQEIGRGAS